MELRTFETHFLATIGLDISPLNTPSSYARIFIRHWPQHVTQPFLFEAIETLIGEFYEGTLVIVFILAIDIIFFKVPDSLLFDAPSLALAAILLVMSTRNLDCVELMNALPEICFPIPFQQNEVSLDMLRVDDCLQTFETMSIISASSRTHAERKYPSLAGRSGWCASTLSLHCPLP